MAIDVQKLKAWPFEEVEHAFSAREAALYALAVGFGADPQDARALRYAGVFDPIQIAPSMAAVLAYPGQWMRDPESGIDWRQVVHGEQRLRLERPLPATGRVRARTRVSAIVDKGKDKGAIVVMTRELREAGSGELLATVQQLNFCRAEGGFSTAGEPCDALPAPLPAAPQADPDAFYDVPTRADAALLYRLCGDMNLLHADPVVAAAAGFSRPILHGLATYGIAGHAVLRLACDYDPSRLRTLDARFTAPAYPGETLRTELWRAGNLVHFRVRSLDRDVVVLGNGCSQIRE